MSSLMPGSHRSHGAVGLLKNEPDQERPQDKYQVSKYGGGLYEKYDIRLDFLSTSELFRKPHRWEQRAATGVCDQYIAISYQCFVEGWIRLSVVIFSYLV